MMVAERLRQLREQKNFSQGDLEKRTGLLRCYISRVENGHTVPALDTLEKLARALEVPLYQILYDGEAPPPPPPPVSHKTVIGAFRTSRKQAIFFEKLRRFLSTMSEDDRKVIMVVTQQFAKRPRPAAQASKDS